MEKYKNEFLYDVAVKFSDFLVDLRFNEMGLKNRKEVLKIIDQFIETQRSPGLIDKSRLIDKYNEDLKNDLKEFELKYRISIYNSYSRTSIKGYFIPKDNINNLDDRLKTKISKYSVYPLYYIPDPKYGSCGRESMLSIHKTKGCKYIGDMILSGLFKEAEDIESALITLTIQPEIKISYTINELVTGCLKDIYEKYCFEI